MVTIGVDSEAASKVEAYEQDGADAKSDERADIPEMGNCFILSETPEQ